MGGVLRVWGESCRCVSDASVGGKVLLLCEWWAVDGACAKFQPIGDSPLRRQQNNKE